MSNYDGFVGGSYTSQSPNADAERAMNFYVENIESPGGKARTALYPTPGLKVFSIPTAAQQVGISSVKVSRDGALSAAIASVQVLSYDQLSAGYPTAVQGTGGTGVTSYSASPNSLVADAVSGGSVITDTKTTGGWTSLVIGSASVSLQASITVGMSHVGGSGVGSATIQYSKDGGSTFTTIATYSASGTHAINQAITGLTNLNLLRFRIVAAATYTGPSGGEFETQINADTILAQVSNATPWATTFTGGVLSDASLTLPTNILSDNLVATGPVLVLPAGRTYNGVKIDLTLTATVTAPSANKWTLKVSLIYQGSQIGTSKTFTQAATATGLAITLGGSADLWGATLTDAIVGDPTFGIFIQVQATSSSAVAFDIKTPQITIYSAGDYYAVVETATTPPWSVGDSVIAYGATAATWLNGVPFTIGAILGNFVTGIFNSHPSAYAQTADTGTLSNLVPSYALLTTSTTNPFSAGANVSFTSFVGSAWLNGLTVVIASATTSTFTIPVTHADQAVTADSGVAFIGAVSSTPAARAQFSLNGTRHFAVIVGNLYETFANGSFVSRGNVANDGLPASISANVNQLLIASGGFLYVMDLATNVLTNVPNYSGGGAIQPISQVDYCDGYFIALIANSQKFIISSILDGTQWNALDVAVVSVFPDNVLSMLVDHREIWLYGAHHSVVYYDSGNPDFPFDVVPGSFVDQGTGAALSPIRLDNGTFWIGEDDRGGRMAWRAQGYIPRRISTHAVEYAWSQYSTIADAVGYGYQDQGHAFWVIYFPTADATWVYDAATSLWHERGFWDAATGLFTAHRSQNHAYAFGKHIVGDWKTGVLYEMNIDLPDDFGNLIVRDRIAPIIADEMKWLYFSYLQLDCEVGLGTQTGQGMDPQVSLRWSNDETKTWSDWLQCSAGLVGQYKARVMFWRLGRSRNRIFHMRVSDPIPWRFVGAYLGVS